MPITNRFARLQPEIAGRRQRLASSVPLPLRRFRHSRRLRRFRHPIFPRATRNMNRPMMSWVFFTLHQIEEDPLWRLPLIP